jgi:hypothetical protein
MGLATLNYESAQKELPPGVIKNNPSGNTSGDFYSGWSREIMAYAEDEALKSVYDPRLPITSPDLKVKQFRETYVPTYQCPSDMPSELVVPNSGPAGPGAANLPFRVSSYRGCAGRTDGYTTWDLYEDMPRVGEVKASGIHRGWRGPLYALIAKTVQIPAGANVLEPCMLKHVTDGASKTMLVGESVTIDDPSRRAFWAYTYAQYVMSQTSTQARNISGVYATCPVDGGGAPDSPTYGTGGRVCKRAWWSYHPSGMNHVLCDGSGGFLSFDIDMNLFAALGSIGGGDSEFDNGIRKAGR